MRETLTAFIMAQAESSRAAHEHLRTPKQQPADRATCSRGHVPRLRPWERTHWGFLPTATASKSQQAPAAQATTLHNSKGDGAPGRQQLPGRGLRERGTLGERPGGSVPLAPPGGEEQW